MNLPNVIELQLSVAEKSAVEENTKTNNGQREAQHSTRQLYHTGYNMATGSATYKFAHPTFSNFFTFDL